MDLKELTKYSGYFIVNYDDFEVIYSEGYENENGMWCYKISDLNKMPEKPKVETIIPEQQVEGAQVEGENVEDTVEENLEESTESQGN